MQAMFEGRLLAIHIAPKKAQPLIAVPEARAVAGRGLEGDRYFLKEGTYSKKREAVRDVTLVEAEALEALERDRGIVMEPAATRRNLLTAGVPLNHLVGKRFRVGEALLEGIELCDPCGHMRSLDMKRTRRAAVKMSLHRARLTRQPARNLSKSLDEQAAPRSDHFDLDSLDPRRFRRASNTPRRR